MIAIPRIGVEAAIVPVSTGPFGELEVPGSWTDVAWYQGGPSPGQAGSSVLAAHVDFNGHAGAFFRLRELRAGDLLVVVGIDGSSRPFIVLANQQLAKAALPTGELFRADGDPVLRLVTCGGSFDFRDHRYSDNVIVTAVPVR